MVHAFIGHNHLEECVVCFFSTFTVYLQVDGEILTLQLKCLVNCLAHDINGVNVVFV